MIDYENPGQEETFAELGLRVPAPASYLGSLMFRAGFRGEFKDWYFSEGGHEGPRKLQGNKSPDRAAARRALANHRRELSAFVRTSAALGRRASGDHKTRSDPRAQTAEASRHVSTQPDCGIGR